MFLVAKQDELAGHQVGKHDHSVVRVDTRKQNSFWLDSLGARRPSGRQCYKTGPSQAKFGQHPGRAQGR